MRVRAAASGTFADPSNSTRPDTRVPVRRLTATSVTSERPTEIGSDSHSVGPAGSGASTGDDEVTVEKTTPPPISTIVDVVSRELRAGAGCLTTFNVYCPGVTQRKRKAPVP